MKKTGVLILAILMVLGTLGITYAAWSQTLTVSGSVSSAKFEVYFSNASSPANQPVGGSALAIINPDKTAIVITVINAYPLYSSDFVLTVKNNGTIPVRLALTENNDAGNLFNTSADPTTPVAGGATWDYTISLQVPDWTGADYNNLTGEGSFTVSYAILATQATT